MSQPHMPPTDSLLDFGGQLTNWSDNPSIQLLPHHLPGPVGFRDKDGRPGAPLFDLDSPDIGLSFLKNADDRVDLGAGSIVLGVSRPAILYDLTEQSPIRF